jgi:glycosyltransferase involved in cell wall biosynthesis
MTLKKAIYYLPVKKKFLSKWEYYQVDLDILEEVFDSVIVCYSFVDVLKNIKSADFVFCWWWHRSFLIVLLARLLKIKVYVTGAIHMFDLLGPPDYFSKSFLYKLFTKISLKMANKNLFISMDQFRQISSHLSVNQPVLHLSSLASHDKFSIKDVLKERAKISCNEKKLNFVTVCWHMRGHYKRKGVYETLEALHMYKENGKENFSWDIIGGTGDGLVDLSNKINLLGMAEQVHILTDVSYENKKDILLRADLYIQPSWHEGFGNAVLEAMGFGVPALVSRYTAQPEVVGANGLIVMEINALQIYEKISAFSNLSVSEKQDMVNSTLKRVEENFTLKIRRERFLNIYNKN